MAVFIVIECAVGTEGSLEFLDVVLVILRIFRYLIVVGVEQVVLEDVAVC